MVFSLVCLSSITVTNAQGQNPKVVAIYPSTDSIPVNVTRFYIEFSKPMQEMNILKHIKLTNKKRRKYNRCFF